MSAAVSGGLNIHNWHMLSHCQQPSMEVSTSTIVTGFPNVGNGGDGVVVLWVLRWMGGGWGCGRDMGAEGGWGRESVG